MEAQVENPVFTKERHIYAELLRRIQTGNFPIDEQIPSEPALAEEFHCSRGTVGRALMRLVQEGLIERKPRAGTRVIRRVGRSAPAALDLDACAFVCPGDEHEGVWRTARGFQQAAFHAGRRTLMLSTGTDFRKEAEIVGRLGEFNVRGAALFPVITNPAEMAYYSRMILSCPFPLVLVELALPGMGRSAVVVDGLHAGYTMTRHLLDRGLRRIGFVANYAWAPFMRDRYLGYRQALEERGVAEKPGAVLLEAQMRPDFADPVRESAGVGRDYLRRNGDLEGIVCGSDFMALGLMQAAREQGRHLPGDLKITGIDDFALAASAVPPLTTYRVPYEELGRRAFETLNAQMNGGPPGSGEVQVRGELVVRASA